MSTTNLSKDFKKEIYEKKNGRKRKVAAYCRVSTDLEDQKNSLDTQRSYYDELISKQENWENVGIYYDRGISGTLLEKRKDFTRMIADAKAGKIDLILCKNVSRFARNTRLALNVIDELKRVGVGVYFDEANLYTLDPQGQMVLTMMLSVSQQQAQDTSDHVKAGCLMRARQGKIVNFRGCYGYEWNVKKHCIQVIPDEAKIVRKIFKFYAYENKSCKAIAKILNDKEIPTKTGVEKWAPATISSIIHNPKYIGDFKYGITYTDDPIEKKRRRNLGEREFVYVENTHEAIVDKETFKIANGIIDARGGNQKNGHRSNVRMYPFSEITFCGKCGGHYIHRTYSRKGKRKDVWACTHYVHDGAVGCPESKAINQRVLESAFIESVKSIRKNSKRLNDELISKITELYDNNDFAETLKECKKELASIAKQQSKLTEMYLKDMISEDDYKFQTERLNNEKAENEAIIVECENSQEIKSEIVKKIEKARSIIESTNNINKFDTKLFNNLVKKIVVGGYENKQFNPYLIKIHFKFPYDTTYDARNFKKQVSGKCHSRQRQTYCIYESDTTDYVLFNEFLMPITCKAKQMNNGVLCVHHYYTRNYKIENYSICR